MADQRIQYNERMVGNGHPTYSDTLNRLTLVAHNSDGSHKGYVEATQEGNLTATLAAVPITTMVVVTNDQTLYYGATIEHPIHILPGATLITNTGTTVFNGPLTIDGGGALAGLGAYTINGPFTCPLSQCFTGSGAVTFGSGAVTEVYPEWWGATGDGVTDDYAKLAQVFANGENRTIWMGAGVSYFSTGELAVPNGSTIEGNNSTILYTPVLDENAIRIQSSNCLIRNLTIRPVNVTAGANGARRNPIVIGEYGLSNTNSYTNIKLENITVLGGHTTLSMIAIALYGPVSNVDITKIRIIGSSTYGYPATGIQAHWGAVNLVNGSSTTLHPNNIIISNVYCENVGFGATSEQPSGIFLSGVYNVDVTNLVCRTVNTGVYIYPGDYGFTYANIWDGDHTRSISISNSNLYSVTRYGVRLVGLSGGSNIDTVLDNIEISGSSTTSSTCVGISASRVLSGIFISSCRISGFYQGVSLVNTSASYVTNCKIAGNGRQGVIISTGSNNTIDSCVLVSNNTTSQTTSGGAVQLEGAGSYNEIKSTYFQGGTSQPNHYYGVRITANTVTDTQIHHNTFGDTVSTAAISNGAAADWNTLRTFVDNNTFVGAGLVFNVVGGFTFSTRGGSLVVDSAASPVIGIWVINDRVVRNPQVAGQPKAWVCTVAGGAYSVTRANTTTYATVGVHALWTTGTTVWKVTTAGTSDGSAPSIVGKVVGDTVTDGTVVWTMVSLTAATFASEGNL